MAYYPHQGTFKDQSGNIIPGGTVTVYLAGTITLATIYSDNAGTVIAGSTITTDENGFYSFWVSSEDYALDQLFKMVFTKANFIPSTYDNIQVYFGGGDMLSSNNLSDLDDTATARTNLGIGPVAVFSVIPIANGGTGATTAAGARTNLGLVIGTDVLAPDGDGSDLTGFGGGAYANVPTQAQAEAGEDNVSYMTALRVAQAIAAQATAGHYPGEIGFYFGSTLPTGMRALVRDGGEYAREDYPELWAAQGAQGGCLGVGDGSTTFTVPDCRGEYDRGVPSGGTVGTEHASSIQAHTHTVTTYTSGGGYYTGLLPTKNLMTAAAITTSSTGGAETLPPSWHMLPIIYY